jgi:hypothetical protein
MYGADAKEAPLKLSEYRQVKFAFDRLIVPQLGNVAKAGSPRTDRQVTNAIVRL